MRTFRLSIDEDTLTDELFAFVCDPRSTRYQRPVVKELRVIAPGMIPVMEMMILDGVQERRYVYDSSTSRAPSGPRCRCSRTRTASGPDEEIPETLAGVTAP